MTNVLPGTMISSMPPAIALDGTEEVPIVQGGTNKRTTVSAISAGVGVVPEAPNDGIQYGRQSLTWTPILSSANVTVSDTPPTSPIAGDLWWNSSVGGLYIYYNDGTSSQWVLTSFAALEAIPVLATEAEAIAGVENSNYMSPLRTKEAIDPAVALKVAKTGDTMTGPLVLSGDPAAALGAATKQSVDLKVAKAGDTMTGALFLPSNPTSDLQAATKQYVDALASGLVVKTSVATSTTANITLSGEQTLDGVLTSTSRVLVKNQTTSADNGIYVSAAGAWTRATDVDTWTETLGAYTFVYAGTLNGNTGWVSQTLSGGTLGVTAFNWAQFNTSSAGVPIAGGTMTGPLILNADPSAALGAATKQTVDAKVAKAGDTMTGLLVLSADPSAALGAATKQTVDAKVAKAGDTMTGSLGQTGSNPTIALDKNASGGSNDFYGSTGSSTRWLMRMGDSGGEAGGNTGSVFRLYGANDAGTLTTNPISISRTDGLVVLAGDPTVALGAATKQYVDNAGDSFIQSGTGAVTRTMQNKVREIVSVMDFGAVGNGVADDTSAIQNAINSLPVSGGTVLVPAGTYKITSTIAIGNGTSTNGGGGSASTRNGIRLIGNTLAGINGAEIVWGGSPGGAMIVIGGLVYGVEVSNLRLNCNTSANYGILTTFASNARYDSIVINDAASISFYINNNTQCVVNLLTIGLSSATGQLGILLDGSVDGSASTCFMDFYNTRIYYTASEGTGILCRVCDTVHFYDTLLFSAGNANSKGIVMDYTFNSTFPSACVFHGVDNGYLIPVARQWMQAGSPGGGATHNYIEALSTLNGGQWPTSANVTNMKLAQYTTL